jgi:hypothetical protein
MFVPGGGAPLTIWSRFDIAQMEKLCYRNIIVRKSTAHMIILEGVLYASFEVKQHSQSFGLGVIMYQSKCPCGCCCWPAVTSWSRRGLHKLSLVFGLATASQ